MTRGAGRKLQETILGKLLLPRREDRGRETHWYGFSCSLVYIMMSGTITVLLTPLGHKQKDENSLKLVNQKNGWNQSP